IESAKDWVGERIDDIVDFATGLPDRLVGVFSGMWDGIASAFKSALNVVIRGWNGLEFTVPGFNLGPLGSWGGATIGVPDIPTLHDGGFVPGRRGSEVLALLQAGEYVIPASHVAAVTAAYQPPTFRSAASIYEPPTAGADDRRTENNFYGTAATDEDIIAVLERWEWQRGARQ
ncbi:MAG: hypothetical protein AAFY28_17415, partial [Actinomycetota bacterium]